MTLERAFIATFGAIRLLWHACHNTGMHRTTIVASDQLIEQLRRLAVERGESMAEVIREALEEKVARSRSPRPRSLGSGASGHTDTARLAGDKRAVPRAWR